MAGYDDERTIGDVVSLQVREPGISRRQAIIRVAGEGSLRRIEMKMTTLDRDGLSPRMFRTAVAGAHAEACPARRISGRNGAEMFVLMRPDGRQDVIGLSDDNMLAATVSNLPAYLHYFVPFDWYVRRDGMHDAYRLLMHYGLAAPATGGIVDAIRSSSPVVEELASALMAAWSRTPGCIDGSAPDSLRAEAVATEEARLEQAGLSIIGAVFEKGLGSVVAACLGWGPAADAESHQIDLCIKEPRRIPALLQAGPLAPVLFDGIRGDAFSFQPLRDALLDLEIDRPDGRCRLCGEDLDWLSATFAGTALAWIPARTLNAVISHRESLPQARMPDDRAKAALIVLTAATKVYDKGRLFSRLQSSADNGLPYDAVLADLRRVGGDAGEEAAISGLTEETDGLWTSLLDGVLAPHVRSAAEHADRLTPVLESVLQRCVIGDRTAAEIARAGLAWRDAGRPGIRPDSHRAPLSTDEIGRHLFWRPPADGIDVEANIAALEPFLVPGALRSGLKKLDAVIEEVRAEEGRAEDRATPAFDSIKNAVAGKGSRRLLITFGVVVLIIIAVFIFKSPGTQTNVSDIRAVPQRGYTTQGGNRQALDGDDVRRAEETRKRGESALPTIVLTPTQAAAPPGQDRQTPRLPGNEPPRQEPVIVPHPLQMNPAPPPAIVRPIPDR